MRHDDILTTADKIERKIKEISDMRDLVEGCATRKAEAIRSFKSAIAINLVKLKNGAITEFHGEELKSKADAFLKIVAEGLVCDEYFEKVEAEESYKGLIARMEAVRAELNGLQSINKHLE